MKRINSSLSNTDISQSSAEVNSVQSSKCQLASHRLNEKLTPFNKKKEADQDEKAESG